MKIYENEINEFNNVSVFIGGYNSDINDWLFYKNNKLPFVKKNCIIIGIDKTDLEKNILENINNILNIYNSINLIGNSLGALICLSYYFKYSFKIKSLFLIDPSDSNHIKLFERYQDINLLQFINKNKFDNRKIEINNEIHINYPLKKLDKISLPGRELILECYTNCISYFKSLSQNVIIHMNSKHNLHYSKTQYINERLKKINNGLEKNLIFEFKT